MFLEGKTLELLLAAIVALVVVGPKDLPVLLRKFGQFMARVRGMAAEFRASFDEMARQSELDDLRKEVEALRRGQLADQAGLAETNQLVDEIHQGLSDVGVQLHPPMSYQYAEAAEAAAAAEAPPVTMAVEPAPKPKKPRVKPTAAKTPVAKTSAAKAPAKKAAAPKKTPARKAKP